MVCNILVRVARADSMSSQNFYTFTTRQARRWTRARRKEHGVKDRPSMREYEERASTIAVVRDSRNLAHMANAFVAAARSSGDVASRFP